MFNQSDEQEYDFDEPRSSNQHDTHALVPYGTNALVPKSTQGSVPKSTHALVPKSTHALVPKSTQGLAHKSTHALVPKSTQGSVPQSTHALVPKSTQGLVPFGTQGLVPTNTITTTVHKPNPPPITVVLKHVVMEHEVMTITESEIHARVVEFHDKEMELWINQTVLRNDKFYCFCSNSTPLSNYAIHKNTKNHKQYLKIMAQNITDFTFQYRSRL